VFEGRGSVLVFRYQFKVNVQIRFGLIDIIFIGCKAPQWIK
jgi:hypothetical protein